MMSGDIKPIVLECQRCGEEFSGEHMCKAWNRKCYCCLKYGHYAKLCHQRRLQQRYSQGKTKDAATDPMSSPGTSRKQRDLRRLLEFQNRKTLCLLFPFYKMTSDDFNELIRRSQYNNCKNSDKSSVSVNTLCATNDVLKVKVEELSNALCNEQRRRQGAEDQIHLAVYHASRDLESCLDEAAQGLSVSRLEAATLRSKLSEVTDEMSVLRENVETLNFQRSKLFALLRKLEEVDASSACKLEAVAQEFVGVTDQFYGCGSDAPQRRKPCRNCGSYNNHHPQNCLARGNECKNCGKLNHFTALCKSMSPLKHEQVDDDDIDFIECLAVELSEH